MENDTTTVVRIHCKNCSESKDNLQSNPRRKQPIYQQPTPTTHSPQVSHLTPLLGINEVTESQRKNFPDCMTVVGFFDA
jgi:hypothetical protein